MRSGEVYVSRMFLGWGSIIELGARAFDVDISMDLTTAALPIPLGYSTKESMTKRMHAKRQYLQNNKGYIYII